MSEYLKWERIQKKLQNSHKEKKPQKASKRISVTPEEKHRLSKIYRRIWEAKYNAPRKELEDNTEFLTGNFSDILDIVEYIVDIAVDGDSGSLSPEKRPEIFDKIEKCAKISSISIDEILEGVRIYNGKRNLILPKKELSEGARAYFYGEKERYL